MKRIIKAYDYPIFIAVISLCLFGLVMVYSSSMIIAVARYETTMDYFYQKQKMALIFSFIVMIALMIFPYKAYQNKKFLMFIMLGITGVLLLVDIFGRTAGGAQSWLELGSNSVQPAEFAKLAMIIYLSAIYGKRQDRINTMEHSVFAPIVFLSIICTIIATQPDYGTAAIVFLISCSIIISSGMSFKSIGKFVLLCLALISILLFFVFITGNTILSDNKIARFTGFLKPFETEEGSGYQLANSLIAIGSGGLTGVGLGDSVQKYGYLPEAHTDFIMAIISEELGIFGVSFVLLTLGFIVLRGFTLSARCKDPFGSLLLIGISSMIGIQVLINVGGVTGLIPITGITLPFISFGGTSLLLLMASMGIFQNIVMRMNFLEEREKEKRTIVK